MQTGRRFESGALMLLGVLGLMFAVGIMNAAHSGSCSCSNQSWTSWQQKLRQAPYQIQDIEPRISTCSASAAACASICGAGFSFGKEGCAGYVEVSAEKGWQSSGIAVPSGKRIRIDDIIGKWTGNFRADEFHDFSGPRHHVWSAPFWYPYPRDKENVLVVRVGDWVARVHQVGDVIGPHATGPILFTMNDVGHGDNAGSLWLKVSLVD
jgi:hypothetical protein